MTKIAIVVSHPIQHFCPQYSSWANFDAWQTKVFFASRAGLDSYEDESFGREIHWKGLNLDFPHEFMNNGANVPSSKALDARELDGQLDKWQPDVVIVYGYIQRLQRRALRWATDNDARVFMVGDSENRSRRPIYKRALKRLILPHYLENVDGFLTVGDANEAYYQHYGVKPEKLFRNFFPINRQMYQEAYDRRGELREKLRKKLGIPADHIVVTMVGKLVDWKRQQDLVRAQQLLQPSCPKTTVLIVGSGPNEARLQSRVQVDGPGGTILAGFVQPSELPEYYAASDIYVHASSQEPHSLAISEAVFMGTACVISDKCGSFGPTDDVRPGRNGFVYSCGDPEDLSDRLELLSSNKQLTTDFGRASREFGKYHQKLAHGDGLKAALIANRLLS